MAGFEVLVPVLLMSQITQIELEPKDCIFIVKSLGIQSTPQIFSTVSIPNKVRYTSAPNNVLVCVSFPCYHIANSNIVLSLSSSCLVLILFSSDFLVLFATRKSITTAIMWKVFLYQVYTNLAYLPLSKRE